MWTLACIATYGYGQVIYEKSLPSDDPDRYKIDTVAMQPTQKHIEAEKSDPRVIRLEIKDGELYSTRYRDLKKEAE
jgi:hypothetical protein